MTNEEAIAYQEILKNNILIQNSNNEWEKRTLMKENKNYEKMISNHFLITVQNNFNQDK